MKRYLFAIIVCGLATAAFAKKPTLTIKNTLGGDFDELGEYDLVTHTNETDHAGDTVSDTAFALGDRLQADYESNLVSARARLELLYTNNDEAAAKFLIVPTGYVHVTPMPQFGIAVGNNFYKRFAIPSAYLAADDTTTKYGRLLTDSLGHDAYFGSDTIALYSSGIAGGVTSNWTFGEDDQFYLKAAGGATVYPDPDDIEKAVDFGVNAGVKNLFDVGVTAHDILEDSRKFGAFAGLTSIPNAILNAGFYYNFTSSDYLPEMRVVHNKKGYDEFKKQSTKYAVGLTGGYEFADIGLGIYADFITGLTNEYIGKVKYYDASGNLIDTKITTIVRGGTAVKYKDGKAKETDDYTHEAIPLYAQLRVNYLITDSVEAAFNFKLRTMIHDADTTWLTFYPRVSVKLPSKAGTVGAGLRLDMNTTRYDGISSISVPFTYTYKFKKKF